MSLWEYKVITSGKGGFATPALLEKFLNDLGRDEWEIIHFQTPPENFLAFTGLARRSTQRDWTLQDAAAAAAKAEAEKLRAEFEAKFKAASSSAPAGATEERAPSFLEEKTAPDDGFRKLVDTSRDDDPEAQEDEKADEWDKLTAEEDELPTFFDAIKPHLRRNQRGPGMSVGVDYLAKKWDQAEEDLKGALVECGFVVPADEDSKVEYVEYDGDLYWLNINRRGELWINTKEKPRPVFRAVKAQKIAIEEEPKPSGEKPESGERKSEGGRDRNTEAAERKTDGGETPAEGTAEPSGQRAAQPAVSSGELPQGATLLNKIRPHMRRNRRGPGGSGSTSFLSRALRTNEADLKTAFAALGLVLPAGPNDKPVYTELGNELWWLNLDSRGGLWINGREKKDGEAIPAAETAAATTGETPAVPPTLTEAAAASAPTAEGATVAPAPAVADLEVPATPASNSDGATAGAASAAAPTGETSLTAAEPAPTPAVPSSNHPALAAARLLLKETRTGSIAGKIDRLAEELGKSPEDFTATLVEAGLKVPEKPREKPVFVEHAGEILWLNKNSRGELWLNAKASKFADKAGEDDESEGDAETPGDDKPRRGRSRKKETSEERVEG